MFRFDVVAEMAVSTTDDEEPITRVSEPIDRRLTAYRHRNTQYANARRIPGFEGYSMRLGFDFVIDGQHVALGQS